MNRKIILRCGIDEEQPKEFLEYHHPVKQFERAKKHIDTILMLNKMDGDFDKIIDIRSNCPNFVSATYYLAEKYNIQCDIYLNGKLSTIDGVFEDFNKFYELLVLNITSSLLSQYSSNS